MFSGKKIALFVNDNFFFVSTSKFSGEKQQLDLRKQMDLDLTSNLSWSHNRISTQQDFCTIAPFFIFK